MAGVAAGALLAGEPHPDRLKSLTFKEYLAEHGKFYVDSEHSTREAIFNKNLELIRQQNADPNKTWFATVNKFTDLTPEEFRRQYHGHKGHTAAMLASSTPHQRVSSSLEDLPDSVDWRTQKGVVTDVKNQGACGSCWAFSTAETLESHYAIATGEDAPVLSEQQLVSCAPNPQHCGGTGGCQGSTQPLGFNYTTTAGISLESSYPYKASTGTCESSKIKPVATNKGYTLLKTNDYGELMDAVANKGPVAISLAASSFGWQLYGGGVYSGNCGFDMDHAVQLVGYGEEGGKMYWLVRNSWGASWGEQGYIRIERFGDGKEPCGVDKTPADGEACEGDTSTPTYCGLCGILSASSYPNDVTKA